MIRLFIGFLALLGSVHAASADTPAKGNPAKGNPLVADMIKQMPAEGRKALAESLRVYREAKSLSATPDPKRLSHGAAKSAVHLIEWTDIRCPHCARLEKDLGELRKQLPPDAWSEESRHFPLDNTCNPVIQRDGGGISCLAAKVQICLAGSADFMSVRSRLFAEQRHLSQERIWEIAAAAPEQRRKLEACVNSPATKQALENDIALAMQYGIEGTPLVVINGRKATAFPAFIYAMVLTQGKDNDPAFNQLK